MEKENVKISDSKKYKIYIEFLDGTTKEIYFNDVLKAFDEQRKILLNKKFMKNVLICKVI